MGEPIQQKTVVEILDYVIEHFKTNPRALSNPFITHDSKVAHKCSYFTKEGYQCAHSICLTEESLEDIKTNNQVMDQSAFEIIKFYDDSIHKPEFRNRSINFWLDVQRLHDNSTNWEPNELGGSDLTESGHEQVREILSQYSK